MATSSRGYILLPDARTSPSSFPPLDTIIQDCLRPLTSVLSTPPIPHQISLEGFRPARLPSTSLHLPSSASPSGIWTEFCRRLHQRLSASAVGIRSQEIQVYAARRLDTLSPSSPLSSASLADRIRASPDVQAAMKICSVRGGRPVFVVTGLKVARDFRCVTYAAGEGESGNLETERARRIAEALGADGRDVVFAYRLSRIVMAGWKGRALGLEVTPHEPSGGFSSVVGRREEEGEDEWEVEELGLEELRAVAEGNEDLIEEVWVTEEGEEGGKVFCVAFDDTEDWFDRVGTCG